MSPLPLVIVGAGGFGRETFDLIRLADPHEEKFRILGFVDSDPDYDLLARMATRSLGSDDDFISNPVTDNFLLAVGDPSLRQKISMTYEAKGLHPVTYVHPSALIGSNVEIGAGSIVSAHAMVMNNCMLGRFVNVDRGAALGHDSVVDDYSTLHPHAVVSGCVHLGQGSRVGTGSRILPGVLVGPDALIGAGAVVTSSVPPGTVAVGVPARPMELHAERHR